MSYFDCPVCRRVKGLDDLVCPSCWDKVDEDTRRRHAHLAQQKADQAACIRLGDLARKIVANLKEARMAGKPVGYELVIRCGCTPHRREKHWRGTEAACRRRARMESYFIEVESVTPFTSEQWNRAFGVPGLRL